MGKETRKRSIKVKCLALVFLMLTPFVLSSTGQTVTKSTASFPNLQRNINTFLKEWLVKNNDKRALSFFSKKAFSNREILNENCIGIKRGTPNQIKEGVKEFLSEFSVDKTGRPLDERLTKDNDADFGGEDGLKNASISLLPGTKYWLFKATPRVIDSVIGQPRTPYLKKFLKDKNSAAHVVGIKFDDGEGEATGYFYFIWSQENSGWKIVHAGMYCV